MEEKKNSVKSPPNGEITERDGRGRFTVGNKGGGRKKIPQEVKEMLKGATREAAQLLITTMKDETVKAELRINCANEILNRVYGKPTQPIDGEMDNRITVTLAGEVKEYAK